MHFDLKEEEDAEDLMYVMNRLLPDDLKVYNMSLVWRPEWEVFNEDPKRKIPKFHATGSALGKLYSYRFFVGRVHNPLRSRYCAHVFQRGFNISLFQECLQIFAGKHDFRAFANRVEHTARDFEEKTVQFSTIKTVNSISLVDEGEGYYRVDIDLESALYRMVRNIVGSSMHVALGLMTLVTTSHRPSGNASSLTFYYAPS